MKKLLIVALLLLRPPAGWGEQTTPSAVDLVARATSLVVSCKYDLSAAEEKGGKSKAASLSKGENEMKRKVSLPILLRQGRYNYSAPTKSVYNGREVWVIHFEPAPANQPGPLPGEDARINSAMNYMSGDIQIDKNLGGIIHLDASLKGRMFFFGVVHTLGIPSPVTVTVFRGTLKLDQKLVGTTWMPQQAYLETWVLASWWILGGPAHYTYTAPFDCGK
jgi:hypothetical protein